MKKQKSTLLVISPGYRVGLLQVVAPTTQRKNGYIVWSCGCDCGREILLDTRCLQRKTVTDCGCITAVPPGIKDLTGQRFGRLTACAVTSSRSNGCVVWRCTCDCGQTCDVPSTQLLHGQKKSCGCLEHPPLKELMGKRFHRLTVTAYEGKQNGMHRWRCRCDCGNETVVGQTLLQSGKTKSCGCLQAETRLENRKLIAGTSVAQLEAYKHRLLKSNTSGYTGVYQNKKNGRWRAQITFQGKTYFLGEYPTLQEAVRARKKGEEKHDQFLDWYYSQQELSCE